MVANRLSEISHFSVLILEAGGEENFISDVPLTPSVTQLTSEFLSSLKDHVHLMRKEVLF